MVAILETRGHGGGVASASGDYASSGRSAASWGAIFAGAFVATATSLILLSLGAGIGLASVSPWEGHGASATAFTIATAIWFVVTQWLSAVLGGYIAGRMRTRWAGTHAHEVFFRDTAHGLVTWAVSTVIIAATLAGATSAVVGGGMHAMGNLANAGVQGMASSAAASSSDTGSSYTVDKLFRTTPDAVPASGDPHAEVLRIVANGVSSGGLSSDDRIYLGALVAQKTGVAQTEAQRRVDEFVTSVNDAEGKAKAAADTARKSAAKTAIYTALSMLVGAFIASVAAALGGRLRDEHP